MNSTRSWNDLHTEATTEQLPIIPPSKSDSYLFALSTYPSTSNSLSSDASAHFSSCEDVHQWLDASSPPMEVQLSHQLVSPRFRHGFPHSSSSDNTIQSLLLNQHLLYAQGTSSPSLPVFVNPLRSTRPLPSRWLNLRKTRLQWQARLRNCLTSRSRLWGSQPFWLTLYFSFNLLLTLSNKSVLVIYPFPYTITAFHALCSAIGGNVLRRNGVYVPRYLSYRNEVSLAAFSVLYAVNIAVSNVSLHLVTVPFHQVVRAITPVFTIALSFLLFDQRLPRERILSLVPVILGVALATYGDYHYTTWGLVMTLSGAFLAAVKTIYTNVLQSPPTSTSVLLIDVKRCTHLSPHRSRDNLANSTPLAFSKILETLRLLVPPRLGLHPLDLLTRMSPLAFLQCVIYAHLSGELSQIRRHMSTLLVGHGYHTPACLSPIPSGNSSLSFECIQLSHSVASSTLGWTRILLLLLNGFIAFGLNVVSFSANGKIGALGMTVAANVKQVLTVLCAVSLFNLTIEPLNALGIALTIAGGAWYARQEYITKSAGRRKDTR